MGKVIKMIDLLNMVLKKEIKDKQKFRVTLGDETTRDIYYVESEGCNICCFKDYSDDFWWSDEYNLNDEVEILDGKDEIDIQNIEKIIKFSCLRLDETNTIETFNQLIETQNKLIEAVKQLDNKLKEK